MTVFSLGVIMITVKNQVSMSVVSRIQLMVFSCQAWVITGGQEAAGSSPVTRTILSIHKELNL